MFLLLNSLLHSFSSTTALANVLIGFLLLNFSCSICRVWLDNLAFHYRGRFFKVLKNLLAICREKRYNMNMNFDLHVHTHYSTDSSETMQAHCNRAAALGMDAVCFTDHLDFQGRDLGYYRPEAYFEELVRNREEFAGRLNILAGVEISEPHLHRAELEQMNQLPYDFILGAVHHWDWEDAARTKASHMQKRFYQGALSEEERSGSFRAYWEHMRQMAACGGFDAVAHIDFPKRYLGCLEYQMDMLDEIFALMAKNKLLLEVNTSSLRCGLTEPLPGEALLRQYIAGGGKYVTLGSDAHRAEDLYTGIPETRTWLEQLGLEAVCFEARRMKRV